MPGDRVPPYMQNDLDVIILKEKLNYKIRVTSIGTVQVG